MQIVWEQAAKENFTALMAAVPGPLRALAEKRVLTRLQGLQEESGLKQVGVPQVVEAFRSETPGMYRPQIIAKIKEMGLEEYWKE